MAPNPLMHTRYQPIRLKKPFMCLAVVIFSHFYSLIDEIVVGDGYRQPSLSM